MKAVKIFFLVICVCVTGIFAQDIKELEKNKIVENDSTKTVVETKSSEPDKNLPENVVSQNLNKQISDNKSNNDRYRIGFQDVLQISVISRVYNVQPTISVGDDGTILLPRINQPIVAVCKTQRELADLITELYKNFLRQPYVNVTILDQRSQPFAVIGAVNKPGSFYGNQRIRLLTLLAQAGGQDVENAGSRIQVARVGNVSGCNPTDDVDDDLQFFSYDLNDVLTGKDNPWLQPGDIVSVLIAEEAYVVGDVVEPTKIQLREAVTLSEAIAQAGGTTDTSKVTKVVIHRKEKGNPIRNELVFNLKDIRSKKAEDPILQGNDIIEISTSQSKVIKKGLLDVITKGLPNIFYRLPL